MPEHNPLILAKQVASLDLLSGGRFTLGVGVGWMAEEFAALGVPFARRTQRTREYVEVMRRLWREDVTSFAGEFVQIAGARSFPKPVRGAVPVLMGGESRAALERAAAYGDGWYGFNLGADEAAEKIAVLERLLAERGRDRARVPRRRRALHQAVRARGPGPLPRARRRRAGGRRGTARARGRRRRLARRRRPALSAARVSRPQDGWYWKFVTTTSCGLAGGGL